MSLDSYPPQQPGLGSAAFQTYEEGTFTVTATGFSGTAPTVTVHYVRIGRKVTLSFSAFLSGSSNATTFTLTGVPAALRTTTFQRMVVEIADSSISGSSLGSLRSPDASGTMQLDRGAVGPAWTASGTKGLYNSTVTYQLI